MTEARFKDDRTDEQRKTHIVLHGGVDTFLSSWGPPADAGVDSRAYWACKPEDCDKVRTWVRDRQEFKKVDEYGGTPFVSLFFSVNVGDDFVHIYSVNPGHPSLT